MSRPIGLTVLAVGAAILGTLVIIGGLLLLDRGLEPTLGALLIVAGALWLAFAYGAWNLKRWAWPLGLLVAGVVAVSALVNWSSGLVGQALVGFVVAVLIAGYLSRADVRAAFRSSARSGHETTSPPDESIARLPGAPTKASTPGRVAVVAVPTGLFGAILLVAGIAALASGDEQIAFSIFATALGAAWLIVAFGVWRLQRWGWLAGFLVAVAVAVSAFVDESSDVTSRAFGVIVAALLAAGLWWIRGSFRSRPDTILEAEQNPSESDGTSAQS